MPEHLPSSPLCGLLISVICPLVYTEPCNSELPISELVALQKSLAASYRDYEILLIVPRKLQEQAAAQITPLLATTPCLRLIQLTSSPPRDTLLQCGLENAIGDFALCLDLASDPPELVEQAVKLCLSGHDVVFGVSKDRHSTLYRLLRPLVAPWLRLTGYRLPKDATSFCCLSRRAVNALNATALTRQPLSGRLSEANFTCTSLAYRLNPGTPAAGLAGSIRQLLRLTVFNSLSPLRLMTALGLGAALGAAAVSLYSVVIRLLDDSVVPGWASTVLIISLLFAVQFVVLAFICEYLARLLDEQRHPAPYAVLSEQTSAVLVDLDRLNITTDSAADTPNPVQSGRRH